MTRTATASDRGAHYAAVRRVLWVVLAANLLVTGLKIVLGILTGALAVVADGFHSLVDSFSNVIGLAAIRLAGRPADARYPYGYRRYETIGALAIGGLLLVAAWEIAGAIVARLLDGSVPRITPLMLALVLLSFPFNLVVVFLEARAGHRLNSELLRADAKHTQTDLFVTLSVVVSLVGVWAGLAWLDLLVAAAVVVLILRAAFTILRDATLTLADANVADPGRVESIASTAPGVRFVHRVRSRGTSDLAFVDLHVKVDPAMSTSQAHAVATEVERRLMAELPGVSDALVHIEPAREREENPWRRMASDLRQAADGMGLGIHDLHIHTDSDGNYTFELHLEIKDQMTLGEAHALADEYEERVRKRWPQAERVITHLEPIHQAVLLPQELPEAHLEPQIRAILAKHISTPQILDVQVYQFSGHLSAAVKICLPAKTPLAQAHDRTEAIEADLLTQLPQLERVTVHVEPQAEAG